MKQQHQPYKSIFRVCFEILLCKGNKFILFHVLPYQILSCNIFNIKFYTILCTLIKIMFPNIILHFAHFVIQKMKRSFIFLFIVPKLSMGVYTVTEPFKINLHIPRTYSTFKLHSTIECFPFWKSHAELYWIEGIEGLNGRG